jgi:tyrosyl-tRNA synthetase
MIIPKHVFGAFKGATSRDAPGNLKPVGTGPYKFLDFKPGDMLRGVINTSYHEANRPYFDSIEMKGGGDAVSAARAVLQTGGSDQWGNLTAGTDLIRRVTGASVHAMCTPLLVKADGGKFGKTESGTIWLDSEMTSPYAFYQFWINTDDRDLELMLKTFSLKSLSEIEQLMNISNAEPHLRHGQKALAMEMTSLVHSEQAMLDAQNAASALFAGGDLSDINKSTLHAALQEAGLAKSILIDNQMPSVVELLLSSGVVGSKNEAKRAISEGSIWINQTRISTEDQAVAVSELIHGAYLVVRKGKKTIRGLEF